MEVRALVQQVQVRARWASARQRGATAQGRVQLGARALKQMEARVHQVRRVRRVQRVQRVQLEPHVEALVRWASVRQQEATAQGRVQLGARALGQMEARVHQVRWVRRVQRVQRVRVRLEARAEALVRWAFARQQEATAQAQAQLGARALEKMEARAQQERQERRVQQVLRVQVQAQQVRLEARAEALVRWASARQQGETAQGRAQLGARALGQVRVQQERRERRVRRVRVRVQQVRLVRLEARAEALVRWASACQQEETAQGRTQLGARALGKMEARVHQVRRVRRVLRVQVRAQQVRLEVSDEARARWASARQQGATAQGSAQLGAGARKQTKRQKQEQGAPRAPQGARGGTQACWAGSAGGTGRTCCSRAPRRTPRARLRLRPRASASP